ncbi:unnamed protein product [Moneuplotes crassus]|uniref:Transmembrane protein n=1 Tax=Euplotes crassus TaxID=5936 RepID=A0AAD2DBK9_EUPCR|nr:unnamed protein product [Moneuplotes crassus]
MEKNNGSSPINERSADGPSSTHVYGEAPYLPVPTTGPDYEPQNAQINNGAGTYIRSDFGWIFVNPEDYMPHSESNNYEAVVTQNIQNLAQSSKGIKGIVTIDMLQDEPFAPVPELSEPMLDPEQQNVPTEDNDEKENEKRKKIARKSVILCCSSIWFMIIFFFLDQIIQALQFMWVSIFMGISWIEGIYDLAKVLNVFSIHFSDQAYIISVITCIVVIFIFAIFSCGGVFGFCDIDCCCCFDALEDFLSMVIFEYFFFGFFAIPIMKMLLQTYDCVRVEGVRVLSRNLNWQCESWQQLLLFSFSMVTLLMLIVGAVVRNLAKEEEMHFRGYEWRIKKGVNRLICKEMVLKAVIMIIAIFGPTRYYFPPLVCCILTASFLAYWLLIMPYVINKYNHMKIAMLAVSAHCFFASFLATLGNDINGFETAASVIIFMSPISGLVGFLVSIWRSKHVFYDEEAAFAFEERQKAKDLPSYDDTLIIKKLILQKEFIGIKILSIKELEQFDHYIFGQSKILEGEFKVNGDEGMINLCIILATIATFQEHPKMYFSKLIIRADKEDQAAQIKFTEKSEQAFAEAYFAGCFRVIKHLQFNQFHLQARQALNVTRFFKDSPTLETVNLSNNQLDHKVVSAIIGKLYENKAIKFIDVSSNAVYSDQQLQIQKKYNYNDEVDVIFA